jgi:hypothetical protein
MQKGHNLQFDCISCKQVVNFSIFDLKSDGDPLSCICCNKQYILDDSNLRRQLKKFEALCRQIVESEEILGSTSVGINIGEHHIKIPYKLLLTRLNSSIELVIGDQPINIVFRLEPALDCPELIDELI